MIDSAGTICKVLNTVTISNLLGDCILTNGMAARSDNDPGVILEAYRKVESIA